MVAVGSDAKSLPDLPVIGRDTAGDGRVIIK
jgi:hypothetical protein